MKTLDVDRSSYVDRSSLEWIETFVSRKTENEVGFFSELLKHLRIEIDAKEGLVSLWYSLLKILKWIVIIDS